MPMSICVPEVLFARTTIPEAAIGEQRTIELRIVNYVRERLLTLQSAIDSNWPEFLAAEAANLDNLVLFEPVGQRHTRLFAYGLGYKDDERFRQLLTFFRQTNTRLYQQLKRDLETGQPADHAAGPQAEVSNAGNGTT